jgi:hypothetical protein
MPSTSITAKRRQKDCVAEARRRGLMNDRASVQVQPDMVVIFGLSGSIMAIQIDVSFRLPAHMFQGTHRCIARLDMAEMYQPWLDSNFHQFLSLLEQHDFIKSC